MTKGVLRPIVPRSPLYHTANMEREIKDGLTKLGKNVLKTFEGTTNNWNTKVKFDLKVTVNSSEAMIEITTDNEIYGYVNEGTKPHVIRPKRARRLAFRTGYRPKTTPKSITSGPGGDSGPWVTAGVVHHPGTKARQFTKYVIVRYQDVFPVVIQQAIEKAAKEG